MPAAAAAREIITKLGFRVEDGKLKGFRAQIGLTKIQMGKMRRTIWRARREMDKFASPLKQAIAGFAGGMAIKSVTMDFAKLAVETDRMSKSLGVSTDFFGGLRYALGTIGIEGDETSQIIADVSERMFDAANGSKALADDFGEIGFTKEQLKRLADKGPEAQMLALADAMKKAGPGAKRTFAAMSGLGDMGARLLPLLEQGSEGLMKMMREAKRLGVTLDKDAIEQAKRFQKNMQRTKANLTGLRNQIASKLLPAINDITEGFVKWTKEGNNSEKMLIALRIALKALLAVVMIWIGAKIKAGLAFLALQIKAVAFSLRMLASSLGPVLIKLAPFILALAALVILIDDLRTLVAGGDTLLGAWLGDDSKILKELRGAVIDLIDAFAELWAELRPLFVELGRELAPLLTAVRGIFSQLWPLMRGVLMLMLKAFVYTLIYGIKLLTLIIRAFTWLLKKAIIPIVKVLAAPFVFALKVILKVARAIGRVIKFVWGGGIKDAGSRLKWFGSIFDWVKEKALAVAYAIRDGFIMAWRAIAEAFPEETRAIGLVLGVMYDAMKFVWKGIEKLGVGAAKVIKKAWKPLGKLIGKVTDKFLKVKNKAKEGISDLFSRSKTLNIKPLDLGSLTGTAPKPQATAAGKAAAAAGGAGGGNTTANLGGVSVNVSGSVNMDVPEVKAKMKQAGKEAMQEAFAEVMKDRKPATTTAGA